MKKLFSMFAIAMVMMLLGATLTSCIKKSEKAAETVVVKDSTEKFVDSTNHP